MAGRSDTDAADQEFLYAVQQAVNGTQPSTDNSQPSADNDDDAPAARGEARTPRTNARIRFRWAIVPASSLKVQRESSATQNRDRTRRFYDEQAEERARNLDPLRLLEAVTTDSGSPMTTSQGVILSGNGRTDYIQRAYERYPDAARAYRAAVEQLAKEKGTDIANIQDPVAVRIDI